MQFDLAQLAALSAAVTEGTFEAAARALNVTPSAVSQRIKALESTVGRVLVQRSKPVRATESGEAILLLARQIETLAGDAMRGLGDPDDVLGLGLGLGLDGAGDALGLDGGGDGPEGSGAHRRPRPVPVPVRMPIAVNADSLATWILPALAELSSAMAFDLHREDQAHTTTLLREGTVMAAITAVADPVQGCSSTPLGSMRYRPMASPEFAGRWFPEGVTPEALSRAPVVVFDRRDDLQAAYLRSRAPGPVGSGRVGSGRVGSGRVGSGRVGSGRVDSGPVDSGPVDSGGVDYGRIDPPRHFVPASGDFVAAVRLGFGWGMVPDLQSGAPAVSSALIDLDPEGAIDVPLYWQQWQLHTRSLERLAQVISEAARRTLR